MPNSFYGKFSFGRDVPSKWITPNKTVCTNNGGKLYKGICKANWENAKKICRASGANLPILADLKQVIIDCGGSYTIYGKDWDSIMDKNRANKFYQSCYKNRGFSSSDYYWSSTLYVSDSNSNDIWNVMFVNGFVQQHSDRPEFYVKCIRDGQ